MKSKLVMTLLVRNEEDILEENICFHLNNGVDFIVAMDNGSTDGTVEILEKYAKKGVLSYEINTSYTYQQSKWVSYLAKKAVKEFKATHLFHCDADEFWYPRRGNLKSILPENGEVFMVQVMNYLPSTNNAQGFARFSYIVTDPFVQLTEHNQKESQYYLLSKYPPKVLTTNEFTHIATGNHNVISKKSRVSIPVNHIHIHHFPIRSYEQFKNKVINTGEAFDSSPRKNKHEGWHIKSWYKAYKKGNLKKLYNSLIIRNKKRELLEATGAIRSITVPRKIVKAKEIYILKNLPQFILAYIKSKISVEFIKSGKLRFNPS